MSTTRIDPHGISQVYKAAWTASSSAAANVALTAPLTLPRGLYIIIASCPNVSTTCWAQLNQAGTSTQITDMSAVTTYTPALFSMNKPISQQIFILHVDAASASFQLYTNQGHSMTYTAIERGSLIAFRIGD